ncbi:hypothetical protein I3843_10G096600 [Carya illinoinensis]|nr:hypothetical protein I3760_10G101400 [Carya illinoinensis]KAG7959974.1 hypothetical protein I3843_10G096600 [Carya illinoinensis]
MADIDLWLPHLHHRHILEVRSAATACWGTAELPFSSACSRVGRAAPCSWCTQQRSVTRGASLLAAETPAPPPNTAPCGSMLCLTTRAALPTAGLGSAPGSQHFLGLVSATQRSTGKKGVAVHCAQ